MVRRFCGPTLAAGFAACLAITSASVAETDDLYPPEQPNPTLPAPEKTIPEQTYPCNPGGFEPAEGTRDPARTYAYDCEGVIDPPDNVDPGIRTAPPVPDAGTMPVIPPDAVD